MEDTTNSKIILPKYLYKIHGKVEDWISLYGYWCGKCYLEMIDKFCERVEEIKEEI